MNPCILSRRTVSAALLVSALMGILVAPGALAAKTKLTLWTWYGEPFTALVNGLAEDFEKENPGISVTHQVYGFYDIQDKFLAALAAGVAPDVTLVSSRWMVQMAAAGAFAPLDPYMKSDGFDVKDVFPRLWEGVQYQGTKYAVPFAGGNQQVLWYNKELFAEAGLDAGRPPHTWSEWVAMAKKLTVDRNADGKPEQYGIDSTPYFPPMMLSNGGDWLSADGSKALWNSEKGVEAMQFLSDLFRRFAVVGSNFMSRRAAMHLEGTYALVVYKKQIKFKVGVGIHPQSDHAKEIRMWASSDSLALTHKSKDKMKAGWRLIKFLMRPDIQAKWALATGFPVMTRSAREYPPFVKALADEPVLAEGNRLMDYAVALTPSIKDKDLEPLIGKYQGEVLAGRMAPKQALDRAVDEANRILARIKKK